MTFRLNAVLGSGRYLSLRRHLKSSKINFLNNFGIEELDGFSIREARVPKRLFGGRLYARDGQIVEIGKMLLKGYRSSHIKEELGVNIKSVYRARRVLGEVLGKPFECVCKKVGGHVGSCKGIRRVWR